MRVCSAAGQSLEAESVCDCESVLKESPERPSLTTSNLMPHQCQLAFFAVDTRWDFCDGESSLHCLVVRSVSVHLVSGSWPQKSRG